MTGWEVGVSGSMIFKCWVFLMAMLMLFRKWGELGQEFVLVQALSVTDRRVKKQC